MPTAESRGIYSAPTVVLEGEGGAPEGSPERKKAEQAIRRMRRSLKSWLKYRRINDEVAAGQRRARVPQKAAARLLHAERDYSTEQRLANKLYALLSEVIDPEKLPGPDVGKDPEAAVKLARIAITGKLPKEAPSPSAQGIVWLWPVAIVGGIVFVVATAIRSWADVAKEKEKFKCIRDGACTDSGFWIKVGAIAFVGWLAWDKLGLKEKFKKGGRTS